MTIISERLGHASPGFTLRQYAHALPGMQAAAAAVLADLVAAEAPGVSRAAGSRRRYRSRGCLSRAMGCRRTAI